MTCVPAQLKPELTNSTNKAEIKTSERKEGESVAAIGATESCSPNLSGTPRSMWGVKEHPTITALAQQLLARELLSHVDVTSQAGKTSFNN